MAHVTTREEHPWPAIAMHWFHLVSIIVLTYTGFYIHRPFGPGSMDLMRGLHFIFMFILILTALVRVYWAFMGRGSATQGSRVKVRDYKHFGYERANKGKAWETVKYYLFMRRSHPVGGKYNTLQKGTYLLWLLLIVLQAITGFAIWTVTAPALAPLTYAVGGFLAMRMIHYLIMWLFIITTLVHIYLSIAEAPWQAPLMFFGRESGRKDTEGSPARV
jgi:Ni/Fe-hydrogenase 1 B-type cytochrome subunit